MGKSLYFLEATLLEDLEDDSPDLDIPCQKKKWITLIHQISFLQEKIQKSLVFQKDKKDIAPTSPKICIAI